MLRDYVKDLTNFRRHKQQLFGILLEISSPNFREALEADDRFDKAKAKSNLFTMIKIIKGVVYNKDRTKFEPVAILNALKQYVSCNQGDMTNQEYFDRLESLRTCLNELGVKITFDPLMNLAKKRLYPATKNSKLVSAQVVKVADLAEMLFHATVMLENADPRRYGEIRKQCSNNFTMGKNTYPFAPVDTKKMIRQYEAIVESPASPIPTTDEEYYHDDSHYERAGVDEHIPTSDNIDDCDYGADDVANYNSNYYYNESNDNSETNDNSNNDDHYNEDNN